MLEFVTGDFFDYEADIRVNTVNCVGAMGAGVALLFKNKFPEMYLDYSAACQRKEVRPGKPHIWDHVDLVEKFTIINFPTKDHWKNPSEYIYIEKGLIWFESYLRDKKDVTVTLPALGCGHGGLEWDKVKVMIDKYLGHLDAKILVFEPKSSTNITKKSINRLELEQHNIKLISPDHIFYPKELKGKSALEIYCLGNTELLKHKKLSILINTKSSEKEKNALSVIIDALPKDKFVLLIGLSNKSEIDLAKELLVKGFKIIALIPLGILSFKLRNDLKDLWNYKDTLIMSRTDVYQTYKKHESIKAFKLRMSLGDVTLINNYEYSKYLNYKKEFLLSNSKFYYLNYWNYNVDFFDKISAIKIGKNKVTGKPNISKLMNSLQCNYK